MQVKLQWNLQWYGYLPLSDFLGFLPNASAADGSPAQCIPTIQTDPRLHQFPTNTVEGTRAWYLHNKQIDCVKFIIFLYFLDHIKSRCERPSGQATVRHCICISGAPETNCSKQSSVTEYPATGDNVKLPIPFVFQVVLWASSMYYIYSRHFYQDRFALKTNHKYTYWWKARGGLMLQMATYRKSSSIYSSSDKKVVFIQRNSRWFNKSQPFLYWCKIYYSVLDHLDI